MDFSLDPRIDLWVGGAMLRGRRVKVQLEKSTPPERHEEVAREALARVDAAWTTIEQNLVDGLFKTYNSAWAVPEEGYPVLSREEFLRKILPDVVQVLEEGCLGLLFNPSDLFLGHGIEIFWAPERMYPAHLIG